METSFDYRTIGDDGLDCSGREMDFHRLYCEHRRDLGYVIRRILRNLGPSEVEDHVHEVFLKAIRWQSDFRGESSVTTWLHRIAVNHCLDQIRKGKRQGLVVSDDEATEYVVAPSGTLEWELKADLEHYLKGHSPLTCAMVRLAYCEDMAPHEIAQVYGLSRTAVSRRLSHFREESRRRRLDAGIW